MLRVSIFLEILRICNNIIAQSAATIVIIAILLSPVSNASKSNLVALYITRPTAIIVKIQVKIFILIFCYTNKALILAANNFTAMANKITPKTFLIMLIPFLPISFSILADVLRTT